jgi:hypothetical protein
MRSTLRDIRLPLVLSILAVFSFSGYAQNPGLTLGGHFIPKDSFMLFIDMGNSTMSGRDPSPDLVTNPHLWKFEMNPANHDWLLAKEPICVDAHQSLTAPLGGPIMPFLKRLLVNYPNFYFGVMQLSNSAWELQGHFNPGAGDVTSLLTQANLLKPNVTIAAIVSMLNVVEVEVKDTANYLQKVVAMVSNIRTNLGALQYQGVSYTVPYIHAGYPVMAGSSGAASYDTTLAQTKSIMRQIAQIPANVSNCVVIPTDSCTVCFTCTPAGYYSHYDRAGNLRWGGRAADTVLHRGWIPPTGVGISVSKHQILSSVRSLEMQKIMFDGTNWSVFDKAGKSFSVYSPNGRAIIGMSASLLRNQKLLPGVYIVRPDLKR